MGRRHGDDQTRRNRSRSYPGGYERRGPPDEGLYGPHYDRRGNRYFEDSRGSRYYDEDYPEPYDRDYERDRYERDQRQRSTGRTATRGLVIVAVGLVVLVGMILVTNDFSGGPDSAQQAPAQQPVQPQQPEAPSPQAPAAPQQDDGASSDQVEGMRADIERQLAEIRQSINQLRLEIWSFFGSEQNRQEQENSAQ